MNLFILFFTIAAFFPGKPAPNTQVYLKQDGKLIAYQICGERGQVSFKKLNEGNYKLLFVFPEQLGLDGKNEIKNQTETNAAYNPMTQTYYCRNEVGYFAISFKTTKISRYDFNALSDQENTNGDTYSVIAEFGVKGNGGSVNISVKFISPSQYKSATDNLQKKLLLRSVKIFNMSGGE